MTPAPFRLSNNQRKQYLTRRGLLRIAIPLPLDWPDENDRDIDKLTDFVFRSLSQDILMLDNIRRMEVLEIAVVPSDHPLGKIIGDVAAKSEPHYVVPVVVATISVDEKPRHTTAQLQWPGDCSLVWPKATRDEPQSE